MRFDIITIFPDIIDSYFSVGIISQAKKNGSLEIHTHDLRDWGKGNYKQVDERVFGGGAGMLLMFEPVAKAIEHVKSEYLQIGIDKFKVLAMSAKGEKFAQSQAKTLHSENQALIILCGRYEGFDQRILEVLVDQVISIGEFVISGGELAAMAVVDSVARMVPGVLGKEESYKHDSHFNSDSEIQYPQYTRPEIVEYQSQKLTVPEVLLSGNHAEIDKWRQQHLKYRQKKSDDHNHEDDSD